MKLMIFAIDALPPDILFKNINMFPNIKRLKEYGAYCEYDTYTYGYGSRDNWISLYTGLTPEQHGIINNKYKNENRYPNTNDYKDKEPFWNILNKHGLTVGMWKGLSTTPPQEIKGYMISGEINYESDPDLQDPYTSIKPVVHEKDKNILNIIDECMIEQQPVPKSAEYFGYSWQQLKNKKSTLNNILKNDYFKEATEYLKENLDYYEKNIIKLQKSNPVDVCFFYTQLIDYIGHFQSHDLEKKEIIKAIKMIDNFIGILIENINPENVIVISDHGIKGWNESFGNSDKETQMEMFGMRDEAIWLENGAIVVEARNKGFLSACHDIKGTFIASGKEIRKCKIPDMRTVDFYTTLLEMFNIEIPSKRYGYVLDIFINKKIKNHSRIFSDDLINNRKSVAIIQNIDIPDFNKVINEFFLNNRFCEITIIGEEKYKETFLCNTRVDNFIKIKDKSIDKSMFYSYDTVILPYKNVLTNKVEFYEIS